jgi:hypothetical protein
MIEGRGYIVRSIPYYEWCSLESMEVRQTYLWRLLASAVALSPESAQLPSPAAANLNAGQLNLPSHGPSTSQLPSPPMTASSPIPQ